MRLGYIRWAKAGPTREDQEAELRRAGFTDFGQDGPVYVDVPPKRKPKPGEDAHPARTAMMTALRKGDEVVIAFATRLGTTEGDTLDALAAITERGGVLRVAATDQVYRWHPDAALAMDFARIAEAARKSERAARARAGIQIRGGRETKVTGKLLERAKEMWPDPQYTARQIEAELKVPVRTLYNQLGSRGMPRFGNKPTMRLKGNSK